MCCVRPTASSIVLGCVLSILWAQPAQHAWASPQDTTTHTKAQSSVDKPTDNSGDNPVDEQAELVEKSAVEKFLAVLVKRPTTGTALERVFGYHVQRGSLAGLIEQLTDKAKAGQATEEAGRYWMLVGLLQLQRGEDAQAVAALSQAQTILKDNAMAAFHHGQARLLVGDTESAATAFELAIARKPSRPDYLNVARELGRLYQREGRVEDALRIWNELEKTFPGDDSVRQRIAATLVEEGDLAGALVRFEKLATAAKNENDKIAFALDAADLRSQLGQKDKATQDLDALLTKLRPGSYLYEEARRRVEKIFLSSGDYAGLTEYYQRWVAAHPDDLNAMLRLARTLSMQGRSAEAIQRFEQAIERAPSDAGARLALIDAYQADLRYADAAKQFEALVAAHPNNPDYLVRYGQALMNDTKVPEADRRQAAANVWRRLTAARPKDAAVHSQVADLMRGAQLTDEAIAGYRAAIDLAPDEPQHKEYLGEYLHQLKRTDEALVVWRSLAAGDARTRDNLVRLAEVLKQFEQPEEALKTLEAACELKPKVTERLRFVEWLSEVRQFDKANAQLTLARQEAENVEDRERVFATSVKIYQEAGTLEDKIKELAAATEAAPADSEKWRQLAVLYGANRQLQEAMTAIERAVKAAPKSIETLDVAARMAEEAGRLPEAIDMRRQLVDIDRRFRSAHLQRLATLYVSTGQNDQALATGKEMLAGAGGAIETFKFYADLCGQLGREDERLDTLRRCVRLNPRSTEALELLANQLSDEFKTDQAIELTWKILDAAKEIEERRQTVTKLTDLYLRNNRLDQLISRLEFRGRESGDRRTAIDLVATAYQQAGDLGLARETLEGLLRESGRDTLLMERLVGLAELAGEMDRAVELQRELLSLAPSKPAQSKLAMLLMDIGAFEEAQSLWLSAIDPRNAPEQMARHIDRLFAAGESQAATELTNKLIEANPSDWEMLTRRMVLFAEAGNWTAAAKDATALLAMKLPDDTESESTKKAKASMKNSPNAAQMAAQASYLAQYPPKLRHVQNLYSFYQLVDERYGSQQPRALPTVDSVGHAKAIGQYVLYRDASVQDGGQLDKILASLKQQAMAATAKADDVLDWYVAQQLTESIRQEAGEDFRNPESWGSLWRLVEVDSKAGELLLSQQFANRRQYAGRTDFQVQPLADTRLAWLKQRAAAAANETVNFNPYVGLMDWQTIYMSELKISGKLEEAEQYSKTVKKKSNVPPNASPIIRLQLLAQSDEDDDALWSALEGIIDSKDRSLQQMLGAGTSVSYALQMFLNPDRVREKRSLGPADATYRQRVMHLLDLAAKQLAEKRPSRNQLRLSGMGAPRRTYINVGNNYQSISIDFPPTGLGPADDYIQSLYSANQQLKDHVPAWIDRLRETAPQAEPRLSVQLWLLCAILLQWQGDNAAASRELQKAIDIAAKEVVHEEASLRMLQADLLLRQDRQQDALAVIEQLAVYDQSAMAVREFAAARLAAKLGDQERARRAARRLFGVRLDTDTQIELAKLLRAVDMPELAADLVRRMRGRSGSSTQQLQSLMTYFT
ncbi:MAG: tetratricopeptide repeat protein, partial [Pirellulaceae bacterium]|nr:tetratricopeptide repeat protein [Pirellulaceae bacterium]